MTRIDWSSSLEVDVAHGYLAARENAPQHDNPVVVLNQDGLTALSALRTELARANRFTFSVAFVTPGAIAMLIQSLAEFSGSGQIITSTYLGFNSPQAFYELLKLKEQLNVEVRLHPAKGFHAKGYVFERPGAVTAMIGSSNLTPPALTLNHEWNLKVTATTDSDLGQQFVALTDSQRNDSVPLSRAWIEKYAATYRPPSLPSSPAFPAPEPEDAGAGAGETTTLAPEPGDTGGGEALPSPALIQPNAMQQRALMSLAEARSTGAPRALVISATGTGKTILSALDVQQFAPRRMLFVVHREQIVDKTISDYRRVLGGPASDYGKLSGSSKDLDARYVFATVQTLSGDHVLSAMAPAAFDYIVFDEAHRAAAPTHRRVLNHFTPRFVLGMTATPDRPDGFNVFELFNYVVPYEIRLQEALENDMLAPFHYYGITDVEYADGSTTDEFSDLAHLASPERVNHLVRALELYGQAGVAPRGLIFGRSKDEVHALSRSLNSCSLRGRPLRTVALTGDHSPQERRLVVERFERGDLDYILTVDIFNEGIDIPTVNQVIMLRQTQSAIVFVQQLGRGLRKAEGKEYLVVIDFIGNYANNFLIPMALFGNESLDKESLRKELIAAEESGVVAGLSSVHFDRVAHERVLNSITVTALDSAARLKAALVSMQNRVGGPPLLWDFYRFDSVDPVVLATKGKHFAELLSKMLGVASHLTEDESRALQMVSHEVLTAKRLHEVVLLQALLQRGSMSNADVAQLFAAQGLITTDTKVESAIDTLTLTQFAQVDLSRYHQGVATRPTADSISLTPQFRRSYAENPEFRRHIDDIIRTSFARVRDQFSLADTFTAGAQYSRKEVTRLLGMPRKWTPTLYGYKPNKETMVCPLFVTLHKGNDVTASTAYEDALVDRSTMVWFTKSGRTLASPLESDIVTNQYELPVFVKKDDAEGTEFYFLGHALVHKAEDSTMANDSSKSVVKTELRFSAPIDAGLYDYFHPTLTI